MIITIDKNNDNIHFHQKELSDRKQKDEIIYYKVNTDKLVEIFTDLFNILAPIGTPVRLDVIDEDMKTSIGEW